MLQDPKALRKNKAYLQAWDPVAQKTVWKAPQMKNFNGGVLSTAGGLVIEGNQVNEINVYKDDTGDKLWSFDAQTGVIAGPEATSEPAQATPPVTPGQLGSVTVEA